MSSAPSILTANHTLRARRLRAVRRVTRRAVAGVAALSVGFSISAVQSNAATHPSVVSVAADGTAGGVVLSSDGLVTAFGQARNFGSVVATRDLTPVGIATTPDQRGYWIATRQGRVIPFGDATYYGSAKRSHSPISAIASTSDGRGYWLLRRTGIVLAYGDAKFYGSSIPGHDSQPAVSISRTANGKGYYVARAGGGVFTFGDARFMGTAVRLHENSFVSLGTTPSGQGYWLANADGTVVPFGDARTARRADSGVQVAGIVPLTDSAYTLVSRTGFYATVGLKALRRRTVRAHSARAATSSATSKPSAPAATSTSATSTSAASTSAFSPTPSLPGTPMHLIFDDEFNSNSLSNTWSTCWWYSPGGCSNGDGEGEWYTPNNVSEANGHLSLTANDTPVVGKLMSTGAPRTYDYTSGMVTSYNKFSFTYGYVEWRAELPTGQGFWPALWMLPEDNSWPPEIDALETVGNQPDIGNFTYHPSANLPAQGFDQNIPGLSSGYHTFGVDWEPGSITWYVDGQQVAQTTSDVTSKAMYLVMNLAVGGAWPGYPNSSTQFPSSFNIDYVRVWQHS